MNAVGTEKVFARSLPWPTPSVPLWSPNRGFRRGGTPRRFYRRFSPCFDDDAVSHAALEIPRHSDDVRPYSNRNEQQVENVTDMFNRMFQLIGAERITFGSTVNHGLYGRL